MLIHKPQTLKFVKFHRSRSFKYLSPKFQLFRKNNLGGFFAYRYNLGLVIAGRGCILLSQLIAVHKFLQKSTKLGSKSRVKSNVLGSKISKRYCLRSVDDCSLVKLAGIIKQNIVNKMKIRRKFRKRRFFIFLPPLISLTKKGVGVRMGKGKGNVDSWHINVKTGLVFIYIRSDVSIVDGVRILNKVKTMLPVQTKIIYRGPGCILDTF